MGRSSSKVVEALQATTDLYRSARRVPSESFAQSTFAWLARWVSADRGVVVTSLRGATWVDAHFWNVPDPRVLMEGHDRVRHLDPQAPRMLEQPNRVHHFGYDDVETRGTRYAPFRAHLREHDARFVLGIAVPNTQDITLTVLMWLRGWGGAKDFVATDVAVFGALAPHIVEAFAVNRATLLGGPGETGRGVAPAIASINEEGRFLGTTPAFVSIFWPDQPPGVGYLPDEVMARVRRGQPWLLPGGKHALEAESEPGGYLLRLRPQNPADTLTVRERQVGALFARGATYKSIATELSLAPATVRSHLQNMYAKLGVSQRDDLRAMFGS